MSEVQALLPELKLPQQMTLPAQTPETAETGPADPASTFDAAQFEAVSAHRGSLRELAKLVVEKQQRGEEVHCPFAKMIGATGLQELAERQEQAGPEVSRGPTIGEILAKKRAEAAAARAAEQRSQEKATEIQQEPKEPIIERARPEPVALPKEAPPQPELSVSTLDKLRTAAQVQAETVLTQIAPAPSRPASVEIAPQPVEAAARTTASTAPTVTRAEVTETVRRIHEEITSETKSSEQPTPSRAVAERPPAPPSSLPERLVLSTDRPAAELSFGTVQQETEAVVLGETADAEHHGIALESADVQPPDAVAAELLESLTIGQEVFLPMPDDGELVTPLVAAEPSPLLAEILTDAEDAWDTAPASEMAPETPPTHPLLGAVAFRPLVELTGLVFEAADEAAATADLPPAAILPTPDGAQHSPDAIETVADAEQPTAEISLPALFETELDRYLESNETAATEQDAAQALRRILDLPSGPETSVALVPGGQLEQLIAIEQPELTQVCTILLERLGLAHDDAAVHRLVFYMLAQDPAGMFKSKADIDVLNRLGTHEYKKQGIMALFGKFVQVIKQKVQQYALLGKYALGLGAPRLALAPAV